MLIYEILTWLIIQLGKLRHWYLLKFYWRTGFYVRKDRNVPIPAEEVKCVFNNECCDCGLVHSIEDGAINWYPIRPKDYKYLLR